MPLIVQSFTRAEDAVAALDKAVGARYLGGGTLLMRQANEGYAALTTLVRSTEPGLAAVDIKGSAVRIGAGVTMAEVASHPGLAFLAGAARSVGGPAIRNMATVGGNLHTRAPYGDFAVALLALDAVLEVRTASGRTEVPLEVYTGEPGAIVTGVRFVQPSPGSFGYLKVSRVKPKGLAVLTLAAVVETKGGVVATAALSLGCMAPAPMRARAAEAALIGRPLDAASIKTACDAASHGISPPTDAVASSWYRSAVLPVHLRRLLADLSQGA